MAEEERPLIEVGRVLRQRDTPHDAIAEERRLRELNVDGHIRARRHVSKVGEGRRRRSALYPTLTPLGERGTRDSALDGHDRVHQSQALEGVACVTHFTFVDISQILLYIGASQSGTAKKNRETRGDTARIHLKKVFLHDDRALHEQPAHADEISVVLLGRVDDGVHRLLDTDVDDVVAIVGQDDVDQVLADVVNIALDRGEHHRALALFVGLLHVGLEVGHCGLHHLGALEDERQLHLAAGEQLTHDFHAFEKRIIDDLESRSGDECLVEIGLKTLALTVDDSSFEPLIERQRCEFLSPRGIHAFGLDALEEIEEAAQGVIRGNALVIKDAAVVHEIEGDLALLIGDAVHRQDLRGMNDRRVETSFHRFVQED